MLTFKFDNQDYVLKNDWTEITISEFAQIQKVVQIKSRFERILALLKIVTNMSDEILQTISEELYVELDVELKFMEVSPAHLQHLDLEKGRQIIIDNKTFTVCGINPMPVNKSNKIIQYKDIEHYESENSVYKDIVYERAVKYSKSNKDFIIAKNTQQQLEEQFLTAKEKIEMIDHFSNILPFQIATVCREKDKEYFSEDMQSNAEYFRNNMDIVTALNIKDFFFQRSLDSAETLASYLDWKAQFLEDYIALVNSVESSLNITE